MSDPMVMATWGLTLAVASIEIVLGVHILRDSDKTLKERLRTLAICWGILIPAIIIQILGVAGYLSWS